MVSAADEVGGLKIQFENGCKKEYQNVPFCTLVGFNEMDLTLLE